MTVEDKPVKIEICSANFSDGYALLMDFSCPMGSTLCFCDRKCTH